MTINCIRYIKRCIISLLCLVAVIAAAEAPISALQKKHAADKRVIHFTCWIRPENSLFIYLDDLYKRSFKKLGYQFSMSYRPDARSISAVELNQSDGDCIRTADYIANNPKLNIIPVKVNVGSTPLAVWTHLSSLKVNSVQDVSSKKIIVGHSLGSRLVENYFNDTAKSKLKAIPTIESGLKILRTKRIDAYIGPYSVIAEELQKLGMEHDIFHAGDIDQMQGNPYLSQKNRYLVEKFEQSLAEEIELDKKKEIDDQKKHSKKMD